MVGMREEQFILPIQLHTKAIFKPYSHLLQKALLESMIEMIPTALQPIKQPGVAM
jgi:hypothetical protein